MRQKRTEVDFSKHIHTIEIFKNDKGGEIRIDHFKQSNTRYGYIKFINDKEGMSVFGDYGNWIFNRPFIPSKDGFVSDHYWFEKLSVGSTQQYSDYDPKETQKELERMIDGGLEKYGYVDEKLKENIRWFKELLYLVDDELEYTNEAYRGENPCNIDYDEIPFIKTPKTWLLIIFDAFDEICKRLK